MLERFFDLIYCVQEALTDVDSSSNFCEVELNWLSAAVSARMPMNLAIGALCGKEANLLTAVGVIKFTWKLLAMKIQK